MHVARDAEGVGVGPALSHGAPLDEAHLRVLRSGMWRVVNEQGGTAPLARLENKSYELYGKTGSAQTSPRAIRFRYTLGWPDGRTPSC